MICEYCNGTGAQHDAVRGISSDCPECSASGRATCQRCGDDAELTDDDGDYICGDCWEQEQMDSDSEGQ